MPIHMQEHAMWLAGAAATVRLSMGGRTMCIFMPSDDSFVKSIFTKAVALLSWISGSRCMLGLGSDSPSLNNSLTRSTAPAFEELEGIDIDLASAVAFATLLEAAEEILLEETPTRI